MPPRGRAAVTHGAHAEVLPERLAQREQQVYDALAAAAPLRAPDGSLPAYDVAVVGLLAQTLCRLDDVKAYIAKHGVFSSRGRGDSLLKHESRLTNQALRIMEALGMTPASRAKLGLDLVRASDLAKAMSEPDPDKRAQLLKEAGVHD